MTTEAKPIIVDDLKRLTEEELAAIEARAQEATPLPITFMRYEHGGGRALQEISGQGPDLVLDVYDEKNREFYFNVRADVPRLAAECRFLSAEVALLEKRVKASDERNKQQLDLAEVAIHQRDHATRQYEVLQAQHRGYDDLESRVLRRIRDTGTQVKAKLEIENSRLRVELGQAKKERDVALAAVRAQPAAAGEGTVMA